MFSTESWFCIIRMNETYLQLWAHFRVSLSENHWIYPLKRISVDSFFQGLHYRFRIVFTQCARNESDFITLFRGITRNVQINFMLNLSTSRYPRLAQWALAARLRLIRYIAIPPCFDCDCSSVSQTGWQSFTCGLHRFCDRHYWYMAIGDYQAPKDNDVYFPGALHWLMSGEFIRCQRTMRSNCELLTSSVRLRGFR